MTETRPHQTRLRRHPSRGKLLLAAGTIAGTLAAAAGILKTNTGPNRALPDGAVALVNGQVIRLDDYERAVNGVAQDRRSGIDAGQRRQILDRMIDEELLLERAVDLGLVRDDLRVRRALSTSVLESVIAGQDSVDPGDAELLAFYERDREFFTSPGQLRVRQIWFKAATPADAAAAQQRAQQAVDRLRNGEEFESVKAALGDREMAPIPDSLIPATKLGDYLGPTATRTVLTLPPGQFSDPVRSNTGYQVFEVVEQRASEPPPFDSIKPQVLAEFRRRAADRALRTYLDEMRRNSVIVVKPDLP